MKRTLAAIGIAALAGTTILSAASAAEPQKPADQAVAQMRPAPGGPQGPRGDMEAMRARRELRLAEQLSAAETLVGVRANQIDAWRDYTSALLALAEPPAPPQPGDIEADAGKAFAREERLVREITERAAKAATLEKAIGVLKTTLTADQLAKLASADLRLGPPMGPHGPGMGPGMGPRGGDMGPGMGPDGRGPGRHFRMGEDGGRGGFQRGPGFMPGPDAPQGGPNQAPDDGAQPDEAPSPG